LREGQDGRESGRQEKEGRRNKPGSAKSGMSGAMISVIVGES